MTRSFLRKYRIVIFYILSHKLGKSLYYLYLRTRYFFILEYNKDFENFRQSHLAFRHADQAFFLLLGGCSYFLMRVIGSNLMLLTHTNYHPELQRTLTTTSILPVAISMMTTAFWQELLFRKLVCSWLAPYSIVTALVSTSLFFLFHMPTNLAHLFLYIGMGLALSMVYQKRENLSATISLHILWNIFTLGATILVMTNPM